MILLLAWVSVTGMAWANDPFYSSGPGPGCRESIPKKICRSDSLGLNCLSTTSEPDIGKYYVEYLYDQFPPLLQRMLCELDRIRISPGSGGATREFPIFGSEIALGTRLPSSYLDPTTYQGADSHILIEGTSDNPQRAVGRLGLIATAAHELGHVFYFKHDLAKAWDAISWKPGFSLKGALEIQWDATNDSEFPMRKAMPHYHHGLRGKLLGSKMEFNLREYFRQFRDSNFITPYASFNPFEDFAETFSFYTLKQQGKRYRLYLIEEGTVVDEIDLMDRLESPQMKAKVQFIESMLRGRPSGRVADGARIPSLRGLLWN